ncbi:UNVERIFIED_CONTAM: hypothetical protein Sradi_0171500 [Sesamum radiatum]|uniref:Reverse transcriptase n=1 Tax=Sesamum radiatum TaxID=300843 RepID=A0AAW2W386_SESRA
MQDDVETYVRTCLICQQDKADHQKKVDLLQLLLIPKRSWESVSMDYISGLPKGLAKDIVSDRNSRFTGLFWTELFKILESKLFMSSNYHPQSDGQTERFNSMPEEYLRHFVRGTLKDWVKLLDVAQLYFNAQKSSSTNKSAFEIVIRQQLLLPHTLDFPQGPGPEIIEVIKGERSSVDAELKKYSTDQEDDARIQPNRQQLELMKTKEKVAEKILNHRVTRTAKREHTEYLVKWKGCSSEENTWERVTNLKAFLPLVEAYQASHAPRTSPS